MRTRLLAVCLLLGCSGPSVLFDGGAFIPGDAGLMNAPPALTALTPASFAVGAAPAVVTLTGSGFAPGCLVLFGGALKTATRESDTRLSFMPTAAELQVPARRDVRVLNVSPGGGLSNGLELAVVGLSPAPTLDTLEPARGTAGGAAFTLTVRGSNFAGTAVVRWNGAARPTRWKGSLELEAEIPAADVTSAGAPAVTVHTPPPGGGTSAARVFVVEPVAAPVALSSIGIQSDGGRVRGRVDHYAVSPEGRWVAFQTFYGEVVPGDTNNDWDVFLRDTCNGAPAACTPGTERISLGPDGGELPSGSQPYAISSGGRYVLMSVSRGALLATESTLAVRDTCLGAAAGCEPSYTPVMVKLDGGISARVGFAAMSPGGRFVAFAHTDNDLVAGDDDGRPDVFVRDTCLGADAGCTPSTARVSFTPDGGTFSPPASAQLHLSDDGRYVTFVAGGENWLRDTCRGSAACTPSTVQVSVGTMGQSARPLQSFDAALSGDGRFAAFCTGAQMTPLDLNGVNDVFLRDTCAGASGCTPSTLLVSQQPNGNAGAGGESRLGSPSWGTSMVLSKTGRYIAFTSSANNVVPDDPWNTDVFVRDTCLGAPSGCAPLTRRISVAADGGQPNGDSVAPKLTPDGKWVVFTSTASNLASDDVNNTTDAFLAPTGF